MSASQNGAKPYYYVPEPSYWPIMGCCALLLMAFGAAFWFNAYAAGPWLVLAGFIVLLTMMFGWFGRVIEESESHKYNKKVDLSFRWGMSWFIFSEVMFFSAFFWAFFSASLYPVEGVWPPKGIHPFDPFEFPFLNTLILLLSGTTVTWAHHSLLEGNQKGLIQGLIVTVLLGLSFTSIQAYEYSHAAFTFTGGIYPSTFFMATGFHGFHVIVGTIFLAVCLWRATQGHFTPTHHFGLEAAAWYWHFVDVVWLFLFVCIYWWGMGNALPLGE